MKKLFQQTASHLKKSTARETKVTLYPASCVMLEGSGLALARIGGRKVLVEAAKTEGDLSADFQGRVTTATGLAVKQCDLCHAHADALRRALTWTAPISLRDRQTTIGCGDRLGRATPGHIRAVRQFGVAPVLAQQSIRELNLTGRSYQNVVDDVTFLVFQEGYQDGFGADGDHLKTLADINVAVDAGMAMITLDLSETMLAAAENWDAARIEAAFAELPQAEQTRVLAAYADRSFDVEGATIAIPALEAKRCAVMYLKAMDFALEVYRLLQKRRGNAFDLEISIDETKAPTLPAHHLFIIKELLHRHITVSSLAPRFIGEFQKAVDYAGDLAEFERQFAVHCGIARNHGNYKVSIHSGSDKLSAYPVIGKYTRHRVHVKTAGTSWLEAVRTVADCAPSVYRDVHRKALAFFPEALKYYHVTPKLDNIPALDSVKDADLPALMDQADARQVLHVTYGGILRDPTIGPRFFAALDAGEDRYYEYLERHFVRHLTALGLPAAK
ncbi:MAG: hypothetical protein A3K19_24070 [Lentisphaerae bacterium RIFOXYB12_FULL_65_16]|nr:MAG: hypothetical protein A3K18_02205 [Lentisphaerae bacterium RIFOXYA12_64_32]OGV89182.1 MAG: hypothetical protein A3K19_24070 [Lentisphaerae bacterium RIFOXYB12_FULL_65_16]